MYNRSYIGQKFVIEVPNEQLWWFVPKGNKGSYTVNNKERAKVYYNRKDAEHDAHILRNGKVVPY
tara:strand:- start:213 stop:407 length:195 start_codon:yes stop_codon:yes gene_type:complete